MDRTRPGAAPVYTPRTPRVVAARRLQRRRERDHTGLFLVEGPQAVREALAAPDRVVEVFATEVAAQRHAALLAAGGAALLAAGGAALLAAGGAALLAAGVPVSVVTDDALAALAETVAPQGLVAVCRQRDLTLDAALARHPQLVAVLAGVRDPGNAGTVLRTADAAGATVVIFAGDAVDPYNGKAVRASAGSLFHVDVVRTADPGTTVSALQSAGITVLAADPYGEVDLDALADAAGLDGPTGWLFGSEAHGLSPALSGSADARVRVPIHGRAESLNLAAAAAVCLYASARAHRGGSS
jgi:TrmH family RNA methyltransferase